MAPQQGPSPATCSARPMPSLRRCNSGQLAPRTVRRCESHKLALIEPWHRAFGSRRSHSVSGVSTRSPSATMPSPAPLSHSITLLSTATPIVLPELPYADLRHEDRYLTGVRLEQIRVSLTESNRIQSMPQVVSPSRTTAGRPATMHCSSASMAIVDPSPAPVSHTMIPSEETAPHNAAA